MATAVQKITLSSARDIPFNKLVLSQSNIRRVKAGVSIEELAASIARRGLIQSLHVRPVLDADGAETGMFEVPAGGRRYRALEMLVKQKRFNKSASVPCVVGATDSGILMEEISLSENDERVPAHPLDQFRAFQSMRDKGMTEEAIAAAFFVGVNVVKQRLRLASVSPKQSYQAGGQAATEIATGASRAATETVAEPVSAGAASSASDGPPAWAKRMKRSQQMSHGVSAAAHAVRSGDSHGGGSSVNLSESD